MKIMGLDIGGANTDCVILEITENKIKLIKGIKKYLPMWKNKDKLEECLSNMCKDIIPDVVCVSMTAELADSYETKREGILDISQKVIDTFPNQEVYFVTLDGLKTYEEIKENPLRIAAANWIGTVNVIKYIKKDVIFMDMGSTTVDIIPIKNGKEITEGYSDLERLSTGELIYTGTLRTNLATIVHEVPIFGKNTLVSSELFAITADIYSILGFINEDEYTCETPDSMGKDINSCKRRLCRLVCADLESLPDDEIYKLAEYIYEQQIEQITVQLLKVVERTGITDIITTSLGEGKTCKKIVEKIGLNVISMDSIFSKNICDTITATGAIQMYLDKNYPNYLLPYTI